MLIKMIQGALIGLGAVLPGISGGVLSVLFGIYKPVMELLANPLENFRTHIPKLLPYFAGGAVGFLGVANLLAYVLETYPDPSVCLFIGLITGMMPSLWKEAGEQGRTKASWISMILAGAVIGGLLLTLSSLFVQIRPGFAAYLFCGFCLALSMIAPGMSFSTLLMPLGLYTPFVDGLGKLQMHVLLPGGIGAAVTVILLAKLVNRLFERHYSTAFHAIVGIVAVATAAIIPIESFFVSGWSCLVNVLCLIIGITAALLLERMNQRLSAGGSDSQAKTNPGFKRS